MRHLFAAVLVVKACLASPSIAFAATVRCSLSWTHCVGTVFPDWGMGSPGYDHMSGLSGNDTLDGNAGNDMMWGGLHSDVLEGDSGSDQLYGESGDDVLIGG